MTNQKNVVLDATMLSSIMACPRLGDFRFNQQLIFAGGKSNSLEVGSIAHFILEHYNKSIINGAGRYEAIEKGFAAGKEWLVPYQETNLYMKDSSHAGVTNTPAESDKKSIGYNYVFKTMEEYFDFYRNDSFTPLGSEEVRGVLIYEDAELRVLWKAKFDVIIDTNAGVLSKDYKTMKQRRDTITLNNQFMGQCVILRSRSVIIDKIGWQSSLKAEEKFIRDTISYSADRLAEWANDIVPHYARMLVAYDEADHFPPNFTACENKYGTCDYIKVCEGDRNLRDDIKKMMFIKGKKWDPSND